MSADFFTFAAALPASNATAAFDELASYEEAYKDTIYLTCGPDEVTELGFEMEPGKCAMTPRYGALVALDRFGCERGLLGGRALLHVAYAQLASFSAKWRAMRDDSALLGRVAGHLDGDEQSLSEAIGVVDAALKQAEAEQKDLVLACTCA